MRALWFVRLALGPVLLAQGRLVRRVTLRLPEAPGERTGVWLVGNTTAELKLLFVGDSTMAGVGARHQSFALASQVALLLATRLNRSVRWQVVAKTGLVTHQALAFATEQELSPADVLITSLGTNDVTSQRTPRQFIEDYERLMSGIADKTGARFTVMSGVPPLHLTPAFPQPLRWYLGRYARLLDDRLRRRFELQRDTAYVSLHWASDRNGMALDKFHPGEEQYRVWAGLLADQVSEVLVS